MPFLCRVHYVCKVAAWLRVWGGSTSLHCRKRVVNW